MSVLDLGRSLIPGVGSSSPCRRAFMASCSSSASRLVSPASRSTWSSVVDHRPRDGAPSCGTTHRTSPPWTCSWSRPLASICSMDAWRRSVTRAGPPLPRGSAHFSERKSKSGVASSSKPASVRRNDRAVWISAFPTALLRFPQPRHSCNTIVRPPGIDAEMRSTPSGSPTNSEVLAALERGPQALNRCAASAGRQYPPAVDWRSLGATTCLRTSVQREKMNQGNAEP